MTNKIVILSGLSGSGKTTLGKYFADSHENWKFIDGDWFFLRVKPKILLSNGESVSNWDNPEAIDWDKLNEQVNIELGTSNVILGTFMPILDKYTFPIYKHIRLNMGESDQLINRCIQARIISKKLNTPEKCKRDEMMVKEIVYPVYENNKQWHTDKILMVYNDNKRVPIVELNKKLEEEILG